MMMLKKDGYNANIKNIENKIPDITNVATTTALTAVENKASNVSKLVKKNDYNTWISEIENKITTDHDRDNYITTEEFNKLISENFTTKLAQADLANKSYIANFVKNTDFQGKLNNLNKILLQIKQSTYLLKMNLMNYQKKIKVISANDLTNTFRFFDGAKYFSSGIF